MGIWKGVSRCQSSNMNARTVVRPSNCSCSAGSHRTTPSARHAGGQTSSVFGLRSLSALTEAVGARLGVRGLAEEYDQGPGGSMDTQREHERKGVDRNSLHVDT